MNLHFDSCQFDDRYRAFGRQFSRPASPKTGISYQDLQSMNTYNHKPSGERRLETPLWAVRDSVLRELLVAFMETRLKIRPQGSLTERRERIRLAALAQHPKLNATLDKLNLEYISTKDRARRKQLEVEIENVDTQIRTSRNNGGMDFVAAVIFLYYRCSMDSVGVAGELGIKPPSVRVTLWRLRQVWKQRFNPDGTLKSNSAPPIGRPRGVGKKLRRYERAFDWDRAVALRATGISQRKIAASLGVSRSGVRNAIDRFRPRCKKEKGPGN